MLMKDVFRRPEKFSVYHRLVMIEMVELGIGSIGITGIMSVFMGAVITIQSAANMQDTWIPMYAIGFTVRQSAILEFAPTIMALILAGKVGSNIASQIGTMRTTEQIDALEIMGINSASYLILPKISAMLIMYPLIVLISMFLCIAGGGIIGSMTGLVSPYEFLYGIQYDFKIFGLIYALIKSVFFAFAIASVPSYHGYYARGSALEVGAASTRAVVYTSIAILIMNYFLTQILLI
jgi:phospholipid/cholesterol/gamma-HCH transport system permease protein